MRIIPKFIIMIIPLFGLAGQNKNSFEYNISMKKARSAWEKQDFEKAARLLNGIYIRQNYNESVRYRLALALLFQKNKAVQKNNYLLAMKLLKQSIDELQNLTHMKKELSLRYFYLGLVAWFSGNRSLAGRSFYQSYLYDPENKSAIYNFYAVNQEMSK